MAAASPSAASLLVDFVSSALSSHLRHDDRAYDTLLAQLDLSVKAGDSAAVSRWLHALAGCSSTLAAASHQSSFRALLAILLEHISLQQLTQDSLAAYCGFLVEFATAAHSQQGAAEAALRKLVDALHYFETGETDTSTDKASNTLVHTAAHAALKRCRPSHSLSPIDSHPTGSPLLTLSLLLVSAVCARVSVSFVCCRRAFICCGRCSSTAFLTRDSPPAAGSRTSTTCCCYRSTAPRFEREC